MDQRIALDPRELRADHALTRAAAGIVQAYLLGPMAGVSAQDIVARSWPQDRVASSIVRAAVDPTSATAIAPTAVAAFVASLQGASAAAELIARGNRLSLAGRASISIPGASTNPEPAWIAEGEAIPVKQGVLAGTTLGPAKKLAIIETVTAELAQYSAENAELIISSLLRAAAARALDSSVLSDTAADDTRPAGILAGVAPLSATAGGGVAGLAGDVDQLLAALVAGGFGANPVLLAAPGRAARARILAQGLDVPIITAPGLTATTIVAVDGNGFYSGFGSAPEISMSDQAVLHFEDEAPQQIGLSGSATLPIRGLWQQHLTALRLILRASWAIAPGSVAHVTSASW